MERERGERRRVLLGFGGEALFMLFVAYTTSETTAILSLIMAVGSSGFAISGKGFDDSLIPDLSLSISLAYIDYSLIFFRLQRQSSGHCSAIRGDSDGILQWNRHVGWADLSVCHGKVHGSWGARLGKGNISLSLSLSLSLSFCLSKPILSSGVPPRFAHPLHRHHLLRGLRFGRASGWGFWFYRLIDKREREKERKRERPYAFRIGRSLRRRRSPGRPTLTPSSAWSQIRIMEPPKRERPSERAQVGRERRREEKEGERESERERE